MAVKVFSGISLKKGSQQTKSKKPRKLSKETKELLKRQEVRNLRVNMLVFIIILCVDVHL